eukprot:8424729-Alexandrium_andersonii.AAC.1
MGENDAARVLADSTVKKNVQKLAPELVFWIRCLVEGLYARSDTAALCPRPACVEEAAAREIEAVQPAAAADTRVGTG